MTTPEITSCAEALRLLAAHLDGELDAHLHAEVERHLEKCRSCYSRAEFETQLKASFATLAGEDVPAELSDRVNVMIREFTTVGGS